LRIGHVYLDVRRRLLHCLNEEARRMQAEGLPFTPTDLGRQPLQTLAGEPVTAAQLPLLVTWQTAKPGEASFVLTHDGVPVQHVFWSTAPLKNAQDELVAVAGTVCCAPPEPDWHTLAGLAHDLRTPLQSLKMLLTVLDQTPDLEPGLREVLERVRSSADRAMLIGLDLLEWCRAPVQKGRRFQPSWFALEPFLRNLAAEQAVAARNKGLALVGNLEAARGWDIYTEPVRLGRLLANLLANAVRYTATGRVEFTASWQQGADGRTLVLAIVDSGAGFSQEDQDSIWQPFARGRAGKEGDSSGSGMGLSVVDRLVEELGLTLEGHSEHGRGSAFHLLLPERLLRHRTAG
jgi:C4-dicarboxylate-specific signal transduction histidine kinase